MNNVHHIQTSEHPRPSFELLPGNHGMCAVSISEVISYCPWSPSQQDVTAALVIIVSKHRYLDLPCATCIPSNPADRLANAYVWCKEIPPWSRDVCSTSTIRYKAMQCSTIQCEVMQCSTIQYNTIQYNTIQYNTIQYNTIQYNTIQFNTIQYNTVQYSTVQCNTIPYSAIQYSTIPYHTMQCNAIQLNTIQYNKCMSKK